MRYLIAAILLMLIINLIKSETYATLKDNLEVDIFSKFAKDYANDYKKKLQFRQNESHYQMFKKIKHIQYIELSALNSSSEDTLNEFLAAKIYQFIEKINLMTIPEFRQAFESSIKVLKYNPNKKINPAESTIGSTSCRLEKITNSRTFNPVPVCSWHWVINERMDKYPFRRALARCNCVDCQAKTKFDSDRRRLSGCMPNVVLMPVLYKENNNKNNNNSSIERWCFGLEEVPTSCICSLRIKPIK